MEITTSSSRGGGTTFATIANERIGKSRFVRTCVEKGCVGGGEKRTLYGDMTNIFVVFLGIYVLERERERETRTQRKIGVRDRIE